MFMDINAQVAQKKYITKMSNTIPHGSKNIYATRILGKNEPHPIPRAPQSEAEYWQREYTDLNNVVNKIVNAIIDSGNHPVYHDKMMKRHSKEWPTLWKALDELVSVWRKV
jgi:hypothetical protein